MAEVYDIDDSIDSFFDCHTSVTRQQCDDFVLSKFGTPARPVQIQGVWSYTVTTDPAQSTRIQFRVRALPLEPAKMKLVKQAAIGFAPDVTHHGTIGKDRPLHIYEMRKLLGEIYILARDIAIPSLTTRNFGNGVQFWTWRCITQNLGDTVLMLIYV